MVYINFSNCLLPVLFVCGLLTSSLALDCYECKNDQDCATTGDEGVLITCNETISTACYYANITIDEHEDLNGIIRGCTLKLPGIEDGQCLSTDILGFHGDFWFCWSSNGCNGEIFGDGEPCSGTVMAPKMLLLFFCNLFMYILLK